MDARLATALSAFEREDYGSAISVLEVFAAQDVPEALGALGCAFQLGLGVEASGGRAVMLLTRAAELGNGLAAHNLGTLYCTGAAGLDADPALSRYWYGRAAKLGVQLIPKDEGQRN